MISIAGSIGARHEEVPLTGSLDRDVGRGVLEAVNVQIDPMLEEAGLRLKDLRLVEYTTEEIRRAIQVCVADRVLQQKVGRAEEKAFIQNELRTIFQRLIADAVTEDPAAEYEDSIVQTIIMPFQAPQVILIPNPKPKPPRKVFAPLLGILNVIRGSSAPASA